GSWPTGSIQEHIHRIFPRKRASVFDKRLFPILGLLVAATGNECFVSFIGDFVSIDQIVSRLNCRQISEAWGGKRKAPAGNSDHLRRKAVFLVQSETEGSIVL